MSIHFPIGGSALRRQAFAWLLALMLVLAHSGGGPAPAAMGASGPGAEDICSASGHPSDSPTPFGEQSHHAAGCDLHCGLASLALTPPEPAIGPQPAPVHAAPAMRTEPLATGRYWQGNHPPRAPPSILSA